MKVSERPLAAKRDSRVRGLSGFLLAASFIAMLAGCHRLEFYEREVLASPWMTDAADPAEVHWVRKKTNSREGSVGGDSAAGGGCGCY